MRSSLERIPFRATVVTYLAVAGQNRLGGCEHVRGCSRVDHRRLQHSVDDDVFVGAVRDGEISRTVSERGEPEGVVEARLEKAWAKLEARGRAGGAMNREVERHGKLAIRSRLRRPRFLNDFNRERGTSRANTLDTLEETLAFLLQLLLGIRPPVERDRTRFRNDVEVRSSPNLSANQKDGRASSFFAYRVTRSSIRHVFAKRRELVREIHDRIERIHAHVLETDVRRATRSRDAPRNRATARIPHDTTSGLGRQHAERVGADLMSVEQRRGSSVP